MTYGDFVRWLRDTRVRVKKQSQRAAAEEVGTTPATWSRWESGSNVPSEESIPKIAAWAGLNPTELTRRMEGAAREDTLERRAREAAEVAYVQIREDGSYVLGKHTIRLMPDGSLLVDERVRVA